jgi:hypothetical protein
MRGHQLILLGASVALGIIWVYIIQNWIFLNLFAGLLVGPGLNLNDYLQTGSSPAFTVLWAGCFSALLIWVAQTLSGKPRSSKQTREIQLWWWIAAVALTIFGLLCLAWFTVFVWYATGTSPSAGMNSFPVPAGGWIVLMGFVVLDVMLLFWVPTLLASPRTYRFVVPGAVTLLGSR